MTTEIETHLQIEPRAAGGFKKKHCDPWTSGDWSAEQKYAGQIGAAESEANPE